MERRAWKKYGKAALFLAAAAVCAGIFYWQVRAARAADTEIWGMADAKETGVNPKVSGRVIEILVKEGDAVKKGEILARIDRDLLDPERMQAEAALRAQLASAEQAAILARMSRGTLAAQLTAAEASAEQARTACRLAEKDEARYRSLLASGAVSAKEYDAMKAAADNARAAWDGALAGVRAAEASLAESGANEEAERAARESAEAIRAQLAAAAVTVGEAEIRAPFDGLVTKKYIEEGTLVSAAIPLFSVQDTRNNWVDLKVKETEIARYPVGKAVTLTARDGKTHVTGRVESVSRKADYATVKATNERGDRDIVAFNVKVRTDSDAVWPGMRFRLED